VIKEESTYKLKGQFICYNGEIIRKTEINIPYNNRAFKYGDGAFETIRVYKKEPLFYSEHIKRLSFALELLKIDYSVDFFKTTLVQNIEHLLNANKFFAGSKIRLTVFRDADGLYTPTKNKMAYLIEAEELENELYTLNKKGLNIGIYNDVKISYNEFSSFKTINSFPYILAGIYKKQNGFDDCILVNNSNNLIEGISSNLFILKDKTLFTAGTESGCINGVMRNIIIDVALSKSMTVFDEAVIKESDLLTADEVFFTNVISGVRWVLSYKKKRFYNKFSKILIAEINKLI